MKIVVDMNLSPRWVAYLNTAGLDAVHWSDVGAINARDETIMAWAIAVDVVVLTHDLDFSAILAFTQHTQPSVVQIRAADLNPDHIGAQVVAAIQQTHTELTTGAIVSVDPVQARVRLLPLSP